MGQVNHANVDDVFTYHAPDEKQIASLQAVREDAKRLARTILEHTPICADQSAAIRLLREAVMTANAAIALKGAI
jgi:predicted ABC-type ATPase